MAQKFTLRERVLKRTLKIMASREPDFLIGPEDDPQTRRWYLTPLWLRPVFAIYAHEWRRSDADVPHDHPYLINVSWLLSAGYYEWLFSSISLRAKRDYGVLPDYREDLLCYWRPQGSIIWHWGWTPHRVQLRTYKTIQIKSSTYIVSNEMSVRDMKSVTPKPITLFFIFLRGVRTWGFHCPQRWKPFFEYIESTRYGNRIGKGCED